MTEVNHGENVSFAPFTDMVTDYITNRKITWHLKRASARLLKRRISLRPEMGAGGYRWAKVGRVYRSKITSLLGHHAGDIVLSRQQCLIVKQATQIQDHCGG